MLDQTSFETFMEHVSPESRVNVLTTARNYKATGLIMFRNICLDSSSLGQSTIMPFGPNNTYKVPSDVEGKWLYDLPSQRQYPQYFCYLPDNFDYDSALTIARQQEAEAEAEYKRELARKGTARKYYTQDMPEYTREWSQDKRLDWARGFHDVNHAADISWSVIWDHGDKIRICRVYIPRYDR